MIYGIHSYRRIIAKPITVMDMSSITEGEDDTVYINWPKTGVGL